MIPSRGEVTVAEMVAIIQLISQILPLQEHS